MRENGKRCSSNSLEKRNIDKKHRFPKYYYTTYIFIVGFFRVRYGYMGDIR